jgi:hypothetical protein
MLAIPLLMASWFVQAAPYASTLVPQVPHVRQKPDFCGEACAEMYLRKLGKDFTQDDVFNVSGVDPGLGRGAWTRELKSALEKIGFSVGDVWFKVDSRHRGKELEILWAGLHADLVRGVPSIVCMHYDDAPDASEHFRLVLGYDGKTDEVIYNEPAVDGGSYRRMRRSSFLSLWPLKYDATSWTVIRLRLQPDRLGDPPRYASFSPADYAQHVMKVREHLPAGFSAVVEPPFVVIGDGGEVAVKQSATHTVRWSVARLKEDFFEQDPDRILDIWLFHDARSFERNTKALFGETPDTPYGYYSEKHHALIMNIGTGGGTLVHEIVHPFMDANFPGRPPWLNEGLGSLFEHSSQGRDGHIRGEVNWRLPDLQAAIRRGKVPSFEKLTSSSEDDFYEKDPGTNYAQSRYLLYYLQEKGLLVSFYKAFFDARKADPTGIHTLTRVLDEPDLGAFQKRWEKFVLGLEYPSD